MCIRCIVLCCSCKFRCVSVVEFYAPRYGTVDADPSLPEQKLSLDWVYPLIPPQCKHLIRYITCMYYETISFFAYCDCKSYWIYLCAFSPSHPVVYFIPSLHSSPNVKPLRMFLNRLIY